MRQRFITFGIAVFIELIPWTLLELNEVDRRRLILAAEIYTETQPAFWRLTGQYARLSGKEVEEMDSPCQLAH
ncbi:hypothetical protein VQH59_001905 [Salmonella enterica]|nr:hypothetical protein [Salmonella enterica]